MLIVHGILLGLALLQALAGVLFFRPWTAVSAFFFQTLCLFVSFIMATTVPFGWRYFFCGLLIVLFLFLYIHAFRAWRKPPAGGEVAQPDAEART